MSEVRRAIVRPPSANFADGLTTVDLGEPDVARALAEHEAYCHALETLGVELTRLSADPRFPDSTFVEDAAVLTPRGAVLTRPGAPSRAGEVESIAAALESIFPRLRAITAPGTLDGGDICEARVSEKEAHWFIGISERTNEEGARQLATYLRADGMTVSFVDIRGVPGILHLKSGIAWLSGRRLIVIDSLKADPAFSDWEIVPVDPAEDYAANCVVVNDAVLFARGFPRLERRITDLGYRPLLLDMSEFQKMDGGLSCLSLRF
jgi:dimethylargininase